MTCTSQRKEVRIKHGAVQNASDPNRARPALARNNRQVPEFSLEVASCGPGLRNLERNAGHAYSQGDFEQKLDARSKDSSECLGCASRSTGDAQSLSLLKLFVGNLFEHR